MPDFLRIERPLAPPTQCIACSTHSCPEGFIDTGREIPGYGGLTAGVGGRIYLCGWCVSAAAKLIGFVDGAIAKAMSDELAGCNTVIEQLNAELEQERDKKLVSLVELEGVISNRKLAKAARD